MTIYKYYGKASLIIKLSSNNYIDIKTFSMNRFYMQKYQLIFFDNKEEFASYKRMMYKKHKVLDKKYIYDGRFIFNDAIILEGCWQRDYKTMGREFLMLNGTYEIYARFGYVYFVKGSCKCREVYIG